MRGDTEQLIKDFEKVYTARYAAPPGKKREAMMKALHQIWEERDREKAAKAKKEGGKK